jgi:hypothetical protein
LCPPVGLQKLDLINFAGCRYPYWMVDKNSAGPKYLEEILFWDCSQPVPASGLAKAFPHLYMLQLFECCWDTLPEHMEHLTSLKKLVIISCKNIRSLPSMPRSLQVFTLDYCNDKFMESCKTVGHTNWQKIEHVPRKVFSYPARKTEIPFVGLLFFHFAYVNIASVIGRSATASTYSC